MPPQAYYLVPVPDGSRPDQGLPPGPPNYPSNALPGWGGGPVDPGYGRPEGGGGHPWWGGQRPDRPSNELPGGGGHPWWGGGRPDRPNNELPPPFGEGPVDPGWGVGHPGPRHPLLWLLPWLISPATGQQSVSPPPEGDKPDPVKTYTKALVAIGPGNFKWAWVEQVVGGQPLPTPPVRPDQPIAPGAQPKR